MDRTNVTSSGYTFNGQNFTNETRTDSQGNNYTVAVPSTISTATLSTPTTLPVTQPQYNTSGQQSLASQAGAYVNTATTAAEQALQAEQEALKASQTDVGRLLTDAGNKGTDIASQYNQQDATGQSVNSLAAKLRQLSARSNALSIDNLAKSQGEINKATGQNITQAAVSRNTADATRENLINQASIAMESAIVNADYQSAKSYADQMVDAKYDKLEADTKAALFNLENNKERFTAAEKKVADATAARLKKEEADIETQKEEEKNIQNIGLTLRKYGADDKIVSEVLNAKSFNEAILKAGSSLQDPKAKLELESLRLDQINKKIQSQKGAYELQLLQKYGGMTPSEYRKELKAEQEEIAAAKDEQEKARLQGLALEKKITLLDAVIESDAVDSVVGSSFASRAATGPGGFIGRFLAGAAAGGAVGAVAGAPFAGVGAVPGAVGGALIGGTAQALQGSKDYFSGSADRLIGQTEQFISKEFIENLVTAKAAGATFGALTKPEQDALTAAATFIGQRRIYSGKGEDKEVVGYDMSEKDFKKELKTIQDLTKKAYETSTGKSYSSDEALFLDKAFDSQINNTTSSPEAYY